MRFTVFASATMFAVVVGPSAAQADDAPTHEARVPIESRPTEAPERLRWVPNKPLRVAGGTMMATGYAPPVVLGVPSAVGLVARILVFVFTGGIALLSCAFGSDGRDYLCNGTHGAIQLLVPFAGPFHFAHNHPHDDIIRPSGAPLSPLQRHFLYVSGGFQIGGLAVFLSGLVLGHHEVVTTPTNSTKAEGPRFVILPSVSPSSVGLEAALIGW